MAQLAVTAGTNDPALPWFKFCKGLAEYRQEHFAQAVELGQKALAEPSPTLALGSSALMAMADYKLGRVDEALAALAKAAEIADTQLPNIQSRWVGHGWGDLLIGHALLREARELIEGEPNGTVRQRPEVQSPSPKAQN
jgi:tetratricopeptide (TPR) repeat protein